MAGTPEFIKAIPILPVRSVSTSLSFYQEKLSFQGEGYPSLPADPVFGSVFRGQIANVNLYLSKVSEGTPIHPQEVYIMIGGEVVPGGSTPEIDILHEELKGKGVFEGVEGDTKPEDTQYSGFRQFDVKDPDGEVPLDTHRQKFNVLLTQATNSPFSNICLRASLTQNKA